MNFAFLPGAHDDLDPCEVINDQLVVVGTSSNQSVSFTNFQLNHLGRVDFNGFRFFPGREVPYPECSI